MCSRPFPNLIIPIAFEGQQANPSPKSQIHEQIQLCAALETWMNALSIKSPLLMDTAVTMEQLLHESFLLAIRSFLNSERKSLLNEWLSYYQAKTTSHVTDWSWLTYYEAEQRLGVADRYITTHKQQMPPEWFSKVANQAVINRQAVDALKADQIRQGRFPFCAGETWRHYSTDEKEAQFKKLRHLYQQESIPINGTN